MYQRLLDFISGKPELYAQSTAKFWNDEHISKGMLKAHLDPEQDAASRNHEFIGRSADWITRVAPPSQYTELLDLGCGPGLYAEKLTRCGYHVTGIDYSSRSLEYARNNAEQNHLEINYRYQDYQEISYHEQFDVITLIYCDFSVFSDSGRKKLLDKIWRALKPNGKFIVDVFTPEEYQDRKESREWSYSEGGFWNEKPHICLDSRYFYEEGATRLDQTVVITGDTIECYNLWDHTFTADELKSDLCTAGFHTVDFYGDAAGADYMPDSKLLCAVATKGV